MPPREAPRREPPPKPPPEDTKLRLLKEVIAAVRRRDFVFAGGRGNVVHRPGWLIFICLWSEVRGGWRWRWRRGWGENMITKLSAQCMPRGRGSGRWNDMNCWNQLLRAHSRGICAKQMTYACIIWIYACIYHLTTFVIGRVIVLICRTWFSHACRQNILCYSWLCYWLHNMCADRMTCACQRCLQDNGVVDVINTYKQQAKSTQWNGLLHMECSQLPQNRPPFVFSNMNRTKKNSKRETFSKVNFYIWQEASGDLLAWY